jgi:hypothetical protein
VKNTCNGLDTSEKHLRQNGESVIPGARPKLIGTDPNTTHDLVDYVREKYMTQILPNLENAVNDLRLPNININIHAPNLRPAIDKLNNNIWIPVKDFILDNTKNALGKSGCKGGSSND